MDPKLDEMIKRDLEEITKEDIKELTEEELLSILNDIKPSPKKGVLQEQINKNISFHRNEITALQRLLKLLEIPEVLEGINLYTGKDRKL